MKLNFRKIASVIASAVMIGSTAGSAFAANYPAPFTDGGAAIVVTSGTHAGAISDWEAAVSLQADLQGKVTATSGTSASVSGGDNVNLATSARKLYYGDPLSSARETITKSELPTILASGKVSDLTGVEYAYTQSVTPGSAINSTFGTSGGDIADPTLYIDAGTDSTNPIYKYKLSLSKNLNVSDATNVQGQKIKILGVDYVIGSSSDSQTLYLYGAGTTVIVNGGETQTVNIAGVDHTVTLVTTESTTTARITVDGVTKTVTQTNKYQFPGELVVYVKDVTHPAYAGDIRNVELIVGANSLKIANGTTVKEGADDTTIKGTLGIVTNGTTAGQIAGLEIWVTKQSSKTDQIAIGEKFTDPVFGGLQLQFADVMPDLNSSARNKVVVDTDNSQYGRVTFTSYLAGSAGEKQINYIFDNNTASTAVSNVLAHDATNSDYKGYIHVLEGEYARIGDWVVVDSGDFGRILEVTDLSATTSTTGTAKFEDVISGDKYEIALTNSSTTGYTASTTLHDGQTYTITMDSFGTEFEKRVNLTWGTAGTYTVFPRIKLANGGWMAFLDGTNIPMTGAAGGTPVIWPNGLTSISTAGTTIATDSASVLNNTLRNVTANLNGIRWEYKNSTTGNFSYVYGVNTTATAGSTASACYFNASYGPAILVFEPKKWDDSSYGNYICIPSSNTGGSSPEVQIDDALINGTSSAYVSLTSDSYVKKAIDKFGTLVTKESRTNENGKVTLSMPATSQMYLDLLFTTEGATVTPGTSGSTGGTVLVVNDADISSVQDRNLIVIGGSCINSVAQKIVNSAATAPICGADFTAATNVDAGKRIIKAVASPYNSAKTAVLVAGYEAADTKLAVADLKAGAKTGVGDSTINPVTTTQ